MMFETNRSMRQCRDTLFRWSIDSRRNVFKMKTRLDYQRIWRRAEKKERQFVTYQHKDNFWIRMADKQLLDDNIILFLVALSSYKIWRKILHRERTQSIKKKIKQICLSLCLRSSSDRFVDKQKSMNMTVMHENIRCWFFFLIDFSIESNFSESFQRIDKTSVQFSIVISSDSIISLIQQVGGKKNADNKKKEKSKCLLKSLVQNGNLSWALKMKAFFKLLLLKPKKKLTWRDACRWSTMHFETLKMFGINLKHANNLCFIT